MTSAFSEQRGYTLEIDREQIKRPEVFLTCQATVPAALVSFLETDSFEAAIRHAVLIDGDTDTHAAITGSVAEAYYGGVPAALIAEVWPRLKPWMRSIVEAFSARYTRSRDLYPSCLTQFVTPMSLTFCSTPTWLPVGEGGP